MDFSKFALSSLVKEGINLRPFLEKLEKVEVVNTYADDHILCGRVRFILKDGTSREFELLWVGWELLAACVYINSSEEAAQRVIDYIGESFIPMYRDMYKDEYESMCFDKAEQYKTDLEFFGVKV